MGVRIATFLFTALLVIAWPFAVQAKMFADCTFGKINTTEGQKMTAKFTAKLAAFKHISHSCFVETDGQNHQNHFLQVRAKRNKESKGEDMSHGLRLGVKLACIWTFEAWTAFELNIIITFHHSVHVCTRKQLYFKSGTDIERDEHEVTIFI